MTASFDGERFSQYVVEITDPDDGSPLGTGFFVGPGWLLTCAHVVGWRELVRVTPHSSFAAGATLSARVQARSAAPERGPNWPYPDIALLQLTQPFKHPCVLLSDKLPDEWRSSYAFGYPRQDFEAAPGRKGSQTTFTFEGHQDGYLKLKAGQARPGLSGAPLICPTRKAVVGIIGWSRDPGSDLGALATPVSALLDERLRGDARLTRAGAQLYANTWDAVSGALGTWRRLFPIDETDNPLRRLDARFERQAHSSPADLLHTDYGVVPFLFREEESRRMREWCRSPAAMAVAIVTGRGGAGKTRFARELCLAMSQEGWTTGSWPDAKGSDAQRKVGELIRLQQPRLAVIDYVEGVPQDRLRADLDDLHAHATGLCPVRVLLLHRTSSTRGEGGSDLLISLNRNTSGRVHNVLSAATVVNAAVTGFSGAQRQELYRRAVASFRQTWHRGAVEKEATASNVVREDIRIEGEEYSLPLEILFEALDNALNPSGSDGRPGVDRALDHEQNYWDATAPAELDRSVRLRCVALSTLVGAWTEDEARQLIRLALGPDCAPELVARVLMWLRQLYPTPNVLNPLRPDRLGEHLIATALTAVPSIPGAQMPSAELLRAVLALPSDRQVAACLDTLARAIPYEPRIANALSSALSKSHTRLLKRVARQGREPGRQGSSPSDVSHGLIRLMSGDLGARLARENSRADEPDRELPGTYTQLGDIATSLDLHDQAERLYRNALSFYTAGPRRLAASAPLAASAIHVKLAELAERRGRLDEAEDWYRDARDAATLAYEDDPQDADAVNALSSALVALESILRQLGKLRLAQETNTRAAAVRDDFMRAAADPLLRSRAAVLPRADAGQVITFHSFQGGTGQTMALANLAWILAANGKRVLIADWNLESPGLHRFFTSSLLDPDSLTVVPGVVNMVREFERLAAETPDKNRGPAWYRDLARVSDYATAIRWPFPGNGALHFMSSGLQNLSYSSSVAELDWERFYERLGGGELFNALREDMKQNYDYALLDSRCGLSDTADICTLHLPDAVAECFTFSKRGIDGALLMATAVSKFKKHPIRLLAVPMRVDEAERNRADAMRTAVRSKFADPQFDELASARYWSRVEIPYVPYYSYEEMLATFADDPTDRGTLLSAYTRLASTITYGEVTTLAPLDESMRRAVLAEATLPPPTRQ